ncbi:hypothetical protein BVRB_9g212110 [Beta vulgaris subsp. vulgaris]|nr:hypothetical protein BVRB_9g212110 [Beta vulgaris subsp. vulgaris]
MSPEWYTIDSKHFLSFAINHGQRRGGEEHINSANS